MRLWFIVTLLRSDSPKTCDFYKGFSEKNTPKFVTFQEKKVEITILRL